MRVHRPVSYNPFGRISKLGKGIFPNSFSSQRGSVLLMVIWAVCLLSIFTVVISRQASEDLFFGQWMKRRISGYWLAKAGVERALLEIQADKFQAFDANNEKWASNEEGLKDIAMGDGYFSVICPQANDLSKIRYGACDEAARLNINTATEQILFNLFRAVDPKAADKTITSLAEAIIDWRDTDDAVMPSGAEAPNYLAMKNPYPPHNANFETVDELLMVKGMTPEMFGKIKNYVTVYTPGTVNFNTASSVVLQALGLSAPLAARVLEFRAGGDLQEGTKDDQLFQSPESITGALSAGMSFSGEEFKQISNVIASNLVSVKSDVFRIRSFGRLMKDSPAGEEQVTCVLDRKGKILYWHEGNE